MDLVYEQDYKKLEEDHPEIFSSEMKGEAIRAERELLAKVRARFKEQPHYIPPENKKLFDDCEGKLDRLAMLKHGRIRSVISYANCFARITVELENMLFAGETMYLLQYATEKAQWVKFDTTKEGWISISFGIELFANLGDKNAIIEEELDKNPEACEIQDAAYEEEKQIMLSNPKVYEMIKSLADEVGMTPEEWYDLMERMLYNNPTVYRDVIEEALKSKRDSMRHECEPETDIFLK